MTRDKPKKQMAKRNRSRPRNREGSATAILESISDACVVLDREWRYTYVNRAAAFGQYPTRARARRFSFRFRVVPQTDTALESPAFRRRENYVCGVRKKA